jgi:PIN domain nuclease of toxin-antitoxin system
VVAIKHALGKIDGDPREFKDAISAFGFEELTIQSEHVIATASLPAIHKDPFDRLLIAQAISELLQLITSDAPSAKYSELVVMV